MPPPIVASLDFEPDCRAALDQLRAALIELYANVEADPSSPQDVARRFGVNKTLTWNIAKVVSGTDPLRTLQNVPGSSALQVLLTAMKREGASAASIERVRKTAKSLDQTVERHFGDRATLDLIVDGKSPKRGDHLELSRKLAFRGNSGLWGIQAKVRLMTVFMAPNAQDEDRIDMAFVRGFIGLRRLRSEVQWPIFQVRGWGQEIEAMKQESWHPLEEDGTTPSGLPLLKRFSTVSPSDVREVRTAKGVNYLLEPGPVGNSGAIDCFMSDYARAAASKYRTPKDATGEFGATISAPTERLIFDLIVHESLDFALTPEVRAFGGIFMDRSDEPTSDELLPIPVTQDVARLPGKPLVVVHSSVPRYPEIVSYVNQRMGWKGDQFKGCRLELTYPPMGSTVLLRFHLPSR
jgi:hypothetical protein